MRFDHILMHYHDGDWGVANRRSIVPAVSGVDFRSMRAAIYVASTIILFPRLGAVVTVGLFITGQMLAFLGLDALGALGLRQLPPEAMSVLGTLAMLWDASARRNMADT